MKEKIQIPEIGYAQVGRPEYEAKFAFEAKFQIEALKDMNLSKKAHIKIQKGTYELGNQLCPMHNLYLEFDEDTDSKTIQNTIDRIERVDWEEMDSLVESIYQSEKNMENVYTVIDEDGELSYQEVASNHGCEDIYEYVLSYGNGSSIATTCPQLCETEPDGSCEHGYDSILIKLGMI